MKAHRGQILRLLPNRVWRTYTGGRTLDTIEGCPVPADGPFPEDWIGSTVRAVNPEGRPPDEGLARVKLAGTEVVLSDLIAADPEYFLGAEHVTRFGNSPMVLVKYLDSAGRLPFQVHPTVEFSRKRLNAQSGKTEAYYILGIRPEVSNPFIYLGFQRPPERDELRRMISEQDIPALERCFDPIPVKPGDVFVVPGGLPHAIGGGILMVEVMEPTDLVARVEFQTGGRIIPESARFMGRSLDFVLDMFSTEPLPASMVQSRWQCQPRLLEQTSGMFREALVDERTTGCFQVNRMHVTQHSRWLPEGFVILLVIEGQCTVALGREETPLKKFDRVVVPAGIESVEISTPERAVLLECRPPAPKTLA